MFARFTSKLKTFRNVVLSVAAVIVVIQILIYSIQKDKVVVMSDSEYISQSSRDFAAFINSSQLNKTKEGRHMLAQYRAILCTMIGEACTDNIADSEKNFQYSTFGRMASAITYPFVNPPASGGGYILDNLRSAGIIPKAYAAEGIGFSSMKPLIEIWKLFRNIAFAFSSLLIVLIGFLIMFRFKINPQTIVTAENSLPRIVITVLLITFSFAIGGLMIDMMYVLSTVFASILASNSNTTLDINSIVFKSGSMRLFQDVVINGDSWGIGKHLLTMVPAQINMVMRAIIGIASVFGLSVIPGVGNLFTGEILKELEPAGTAIALIVDAFVLVFAAGFTAFIISMIIIFLSAIVLFFRILILLFSAYFRIIFNILFSPLILLTGILPGRNTFGKWIRVLAADLIVFPVVMSLIILSSIIVKLPVGGQIWQPPFLYTAADPGAFKVILGIGLLFMIPDFVRSIRELMGVKGSPFKFGLGIFFGAAALGGGALKGTMGMFGSFGSISHSLTGFASLREKGLKGFLKSGSGSTH